MYTSRATEVLPPPPPLYRVLIWFLLLFSSRFVFNWFMVFDYVLVYDFTYSVVDKYLLSLKHHFCSIYQASLHMTIAFSISNICIPDKNLLVCFRILFCQLSVSKRNMSLVVIFESFILLLWTDTYTFVYVICFSAYRYRHL
jgi:hypothetical protein